MTFRVVSWNIASNTFGLATSEGAWAYILDALVPDVALVQEARPSARFEVSDGSTFVWRGAWEGGWGSGVWVRPGLGCQPIPELVPEVWHDWVRISAATVEAPSGEPLFVASVHPYFDRFTGPGSADGSTSLTRDSPGSAYLWTCDVAYHLLATAIPDGQPFIVGGDWNTDRLFDTTTTLDPGTGEGFFIRAEQRGWSECTRAEPGTTRRTWFRDGNHGYQLDHVFADSATGQSLIECKVIDSAAVDQGLSDHAPLVLEFDL